MKSFFTILIIFTFYLTVKSQASVDLQAISVDPMKFPLAVNEETNLVVAMINNGPDAIPITEAIMNITISNTLGFGDISIISDDCGSIWEVTAYNEADRTIYFATNGGPMPFNQLCLISIPIIGVQEGTADVNVASSLSLDASSSDRNGFNQSVSSEFTVEGILPIELLSFSAVPGESEVKLEWETATEINNSHFEVQRSGDGRSYTSIGRVAGHGNSSLVIEYEFTDDSPLSGKSYYRLKQVDLDGSFSYSPVKEVSFGAGSELKIYPNPAASGMEINIRGEKIRTVRIYNMVGQMVLEQEYARPLNQVTISSGNLPQGIYITRINEISEKRLMIK